MKLYEIDAAILDCIDTESGEIIDETKLENLKIERDSKIENVCLWIKNLNAEIEALKAEKQAFAHRQQVAENKVESLKKYMTTYLDGKKFETTKVKVSFRKSESVDVSDLSAIPKEYLKFKEPEADKTKLKQALKKGETFKGVSLVEKNNIQIK